MLAAGDGTYGQCEVGDWTDIVAVAAGDSHTVGLRTDGTVTAVGRDSSGKCAVDDWEHIIAVAAGMDHTLGLRQNGTVLATGEGLFGSCAVGNWTNVAAIAAGHIHTIGILRDGRVQEADGFVAPGVLDWTDIASVAVSPFHTVGVKTDGTVLASGDIQYGQCQVEDWTDIKAAAAGGAAYRWLEKGRYCDRRRRQRSPAVRRGRMEAMGRLTI